MSIFIVVLNLQLTVNSNEQKMLFGAENQKYFHECKIIPSGDSVKGQNNGIRKTLDWPSYETGLKSYQEVVIYVIS